MPLQVVAGDIYPALEKGTLDAADGSLSAFRNESLAWNQIAELSFDSFMMRMRTRA